MAHDFLEKPPFALDDAITTLSDLPATTVILRMRVAECNNDLLKLIVSRFPNLQELTLLPKHYGHPFGDVTLTSDDFTADSTTKGDTSTAKATAIAVGKSVGSRYAGVLTPLHNLEVLSLGVSLYGPYGTGGGADEEPEVADVEMNMNLVASERIAQALPKLQKIIWQNVTPESGADVAPDEDGEGVIGKFALQGLAFEVVRDDHGNFARVQTAAG